MTATFTIGAETANARNIAVQIGSKPFRGGVARNVGTKRVVDMYLSSDSAGAVPVNADGLDLAQSAGVAGKLLDVSIDSARKTFSMLTNATGKVDVVLTNATDASLTTYLNVIDPETGKVTTSAAIVFADNTP